MTKIISYIHLLGCIGWSIFGFYLLMTEGSPPFGAILLLFAAYATTLSGIYLFVIRKQDLVVQLWEIKKLMRPQVILWIGILLIVLMCLFPPWVAMGEGRAGVFLGHVYLFSDSLERAHIDLVRLIDQCVIVGLITGGLLYTLKDKKAERAEK